MLTSHFVSLFSTLVLFHFRCLVFEQELVFPAINSSTLNSVILSYFETLTVLNSLRQEE